MDFSGKLQLAERAARKAGELIRGAQGFRVDQKAAHDYVTEMDVASERLIRETLLTAYPGDGFYGEEMGGDETSAGRWIVDPIDGTTNYIHGIPQYSISIAYEYQGELALGCVYCPPLDEMFLAERGKGATLNGTPIAVSGATDISSALIGMSFAHRHQRDRDKMQSVIPGLLREVSDLRRIGSAAVDLCYVAMGRLDAFMELSLSLYDIAAGIVIAREAGAVVTGWPGEADCEKTGNVLSGTPCVHAFLTEYLRS